MNRQLIILALLLVPVATAAQDPTAIIKEGITKVIKAVDLQIQRMQTKTIWLQEAQKTIENVMSELALDDIRNWVQAQKDLYDGYFQELWRVRSTIALYSRIAAIVQRQEQLVKGFQRAISLFRQSGKFTAGELSSMENVYTGIVKESNVNLDRLFLVITAFSTQMTDAQRITLIDQSGDRVDTGLRNLNHFNDQNGLLLLQRGADQSEIDLLKNLYGL